MLNWTFGGITAIMGGSGFTLMSTGIGLILGIALEVAAVIVVAPLGIFASSRCSKKATKHDEIRVLALSKLDTVKDHISKALEDGSIDDREFKLILDEIAKYRTMKDEIRHKYTKSDEIDEQAKKELIEQGRSEALVSLMEKLTGTSKSPST